MRNIILGLVTMVALALGASTVWAQDNGAAPAPSGMSSETTSGTVVSTDGKNLTITTDSGQQMKFAIDASAPAMPTNLRGGARVDVTYTVESDGSYDATKVMLSSSDGSSSGGGSSRSGGSTGSSGSTYDNTGVGSDNSARGTSGTTDRTSTMSGNDSKRLPRTASPLPLIGITGLIALGGALAFRLTQRS